MRDFLPEEVRRREHVIAVVSRVYQRYGFEPLETPAVENLETLVGRYGEEGNRLIFKILKRGAQESTGEADLALRYDLTVPLARVIAQYQSRLPRLFRRYQIQPVWRADRPARGRFREFYQCDVDVLGSRSPVVEAELCGAAADVLAELGFEDFVVRVNHRQLLAAVLSVTGVPVALHEQALVALDKLEKIGAGGVAAELADRGIGGSAQAALLGVFDAGTSSSGTLEPLAALVAGDEAGSSAVANLRAILELSDATKAAGRVRFDPTLARGLSYYTGAIMEINIPGLAGSIAGGGRYDELVGMFLGQSVPACGLSLGLERILVVMGERQMFPASLESASADVMVSVFDRPGMSHALRLAADLRGAGLRVLVYPDADRLGRQLKYADSRGIPFVAILGGNEIATDTVTVKNLGAQTQHTYGRATAGAAIREALAHRG
jgi:histidyl-tRNA synthetase